MGTYVRDFYNSGYYSIYTFSPPVVLYLVKLLGNNGSNKVSFLFLFQSNLNFVSFTILIDLLDIVDILGPSHVLSESDDSIILSSISSIIEFFSFCSNLTFLDVVALCQI